MGYIANKVLEENNKKLDRLLFDVAYIKNHIQHKTEDTDENKISKV